MCTVTHWYVYHDSFICIPTHCGLQPPHVYVWHDSSICVTWLMHICVAWLIDMCAMFIHMCGVTHWDMTWLIHMCDMTHWHLCHDSFIYGVATIRRLLKIIRLFCKRALQKRLYSAIANMNEYIEMCAMIHSYI